MKVLITGIAGFAGSHLADYLLGMGNVRVFGVDLSASNTLNIRQNLDRIKLYRADLRDSVKVYNIIAKVRPEFIFHLAGQSFPAGSWAKPMDSLLNNISGTLNILEAVKKAELGSRIHIACSSEEYGGSENKKKPLKESNIFMPLSPYAVGKIAQDMLGFQYYKAFNMFIVRTRAFNHIGPRLADNFAASSFAKQIALIEKDKQPPFIYSGNLDVLRDFTDVRDVVKGYWLSLLKGNPGEVYNICSGTGYKIRDILDILLSFSDKKIKIKVDKLRLRRSDVLTVIGDNSKFIRKTGWKPRIPIWDTLRDILDYWRQRV
ncbi:MAG: GDP-mannose 4,6-dehydratase [Candidatus Omnitrophota bacterium]|nr:GDP-mannose 4,6-dehydratase [Candidatus Omnitrophota bacterium]MBU1929456.1 GDP-mannose 4,6-dehydratase [Candidatus Omnitrophota bacterium]MBU2034820.1 GDP-mannose 4,6-dehydratase [Candidatus Omnitrophota bacterium]MBU2221171.1 GDP-mannose 4,6-dehydratase [Candidatus Omnitrophota bacterium]